MRKALSIIIFILTVLLFIACDPSLNRLADQIVLEPDTQDDTTVKSITLTLGLPSEYVEGVSVYVEYRLTVPGIESDTVIEGGTTLVATSDNDGSVVAVLKLSDNISNGIYEGAVTVRKNSDAVSYSIQYFSGLVISDSSLTAEASLDFSLPSAPEASEYYYLTGSTSVKLASTSSDATIYYTTDGSEPSTSSTVYGPDERISGIVLTSNGENTVRAISYSSDSGVSSVYSETFNVYNGITAPVLRELIYEESFATMMVLLPDDLYDEDTVYYTIDGSDPYPSSETSELYNEYSGLKISVMSSGEEEAAVLKATIFGPANSDGSYTIFSDSASMTIYQPEAPVFNSVSSSESTDKGTVTATASSYISSIENGKRLVIYYSNTDDPVNEPEDLNYTQSRSLSVGYVKGTPIFARAAVVSSNFATVYEWSELSTFLVDSISAVPEIGVVVADNAEGSSGTVSISISDISSVSGSLYALYYTLDGSDPMEDLSSAISVSISDVPVEISVDSSASNITARIGKKISASASAPAVWSDKAELPVVLVTAPSAEESASASGDNYRRLEFNEISSGSYTCEIRYTNNVDPRTSSTYSTVKDNVIDNITSGTDILARVAVLNGSKEVISWSTLFETRVGAPAVPEIGEVVLSLDESNTVATGKLAIDPVENASIMYYIGDSAASDTSALENKYDEAADITIDVGKYLSIAAVKDYGETTEVWSDIRSILIESPSAPEIGLLTMTDDSSGSILVSGSSGASETWYSKTSDFDPRTENDTSTKLNDSSVQVGEEDDVIWVRSKVESDSVSYWTVSMAELIKPAAPVFEVFYLEDDSEYARQAVTAKDYTEEGYTTRIVYTTLAGDPGPTDSIVGEDGYVYNISEAYPARARVIVYNGSDAVAYSAVAEDTVDYDINPTSTTEAGSSEGEWIIVPTAPDEKNGSLYWTKKSDNTLLGEDLTSSDTFNTVDERDTGSLETGSVIYARFVLKDESGGILGYSRKTELCTYEIGQKLSVDDHEVVVFLVDDFTYEGTEYKAMAVLASSELSGAGLSGKIQWGSYGTEQGAVMQNKSVGGGIANSDIEDKESSLRDELFKVYDNGSLVAGTTIWSTLTNFRENNIQNTASRIKWFVPDNEELEKMYEVADKLDGVTLNIAAGIWSSTEDESNSSNSKERAYKFGTVGGENKINPTAKSSVSNYAIFCRALEKVKLD